MPASWWLTAASIELFIDGTVEALPMPTTIKAKLSSQKELCGSTWDNSPNPTTWSARPVVMILSALVRWAIRADVSEEMVMTAVNGMNARPVWMAS